MDFYYHDSCADRILAAITSIRPSTRRSRLGLGWDSLRELKLEHKSEPRVRASGDWTQEPGSPVANHDHHPNTGGHDQYVVTITS